MEKHALSASNPSHRFGGFRDEFIPVPADFFAELLAQIDSLDELKLTLYLLWRVAISESELAYWSRRELFADIHLLQVFHTDSKLAENITSHALENTVRRGTLLQIKTGQNQDIYYFLNTGRGQAAVAAIERGEWKPQADVELLARREVPNIFQLYEENIGPLTPLIADALRDAELLYPPKWINEAIQIAVKNNARNWRYVEAILEKWQIEGHHERKDRQDTQEDRRRYAEWDSSER